MHKSEHDAYIIDKNYEKKAANHKPRGQGNLREGDTRIIMHINVHTKTSALTYST